MIPCIINKNKEAASIKLADVLTIDIGPFDRYCTSAFETRIKKKTVYEADAFLQLKKDENRKKEYYLLKINEDGIVLSACDESGIILGLTTLFQLIKDNECNIQTIEDGPEQGYRGLLLDCARHYFEVDEILKVIETMAMLKMNALHWHLSDDQGFRLALKEYPLLEKDNQVYSEEEIRKIVSFSKERNITVIPEMDMPGHMSALLSLYPQYGCEGAAYEKQSGSGVFNGVLCVGKEETFTLAEIIINKICDLFPSKYIHIGGDEVPKKNWENCPCCQQRMKTEKIADLEHLQGYFTHRIIALLKDRNRQPICFNDALNGLPLADMKEIIVQYWSPDTDDSKMGIYSKMGGRYIYSNCYKYYLDFCHSMIPLKKVFETQPDIEGALCKNDRGFMGCECALWTEKIDTEEKLEQQLLPRLLAFAQQSYRRMTDYTEFEKEALNFLAEHQELHFTDQTMWNPQGESRTAEIMSHFKTLLAAKTKKTDTSNVSLKPEQLKRFVSEYLQPQDLPMVKSLIFKDGPVESVQAREPVKEIENPPVADYEIRNSKSVYDIAAECTLFLKRNDDFPLSEPCEIALYGSGVRHTQKGGTGSGDVNSRSVSNIETTLAKAGFTIKTGQWLDSYDELVQKVHEKHVTEIRNELMAHHYDAIVSAELGEEIGEYNLPIDRQCDVAVYVLSRISGEGKDRQIENDFCLSDEEIRDIHQIASLYKKFMLVLNTASVVDLSPIVDRVENILLLSQLGIATSITFKDILLGKCNPSGKLTATWSKKEDYAYLDEFGAIDDTYYKEGLQVGYRGFSARKQIAMYPFGFGMSYTDFSIRPVCVEASDEYCVVKTEVRNTGNVAGKEVVQCYAVKAQRDFIELVGFAKSPLINPGQTEMVEVIIPFEELAQYDCQSKQRILKAGEYNLYIGNDSVHLQPCYCFKQEKDKPVIKADEKDEQWQCLMQQARQTAQQLDEETLMYLNIGRFKETSGMLTVGSSVFSVAGATGELTNKAEKYGVSRLVMADGPAGLRLDQLYGKDKEGIYSVRNSQIVRIREYLPAHIIDLINKAKAKLLARNGEICGQFCTAIPVGTALAQSFNEKVWQCCGNIVGDEMERFNIDLWLAPALNIQRLPLCGRNFEYYSEDPLLSGKTAASIVKAVQSHQGKAVVIKHFAANNQETNRYRSNSIMDEQTLHEIYLRGFEICIAESKPLALMTSYNLINGTHTAEDRYLLQDILRKQMKFKGLIMTDWTTQSAEKSRQSKYKTASIIGTIKAGNNLFMPGCIQDYEKLQKAMSDHELMRSDLENNAQYIIALSFYLKGKMAISEKPEAIRKQVVCLGDSITYGAGVIYDQGRLSYPAILEKLSENKLQTHNFGLIGATAADGTDCPYRESSQYRNALKQNADLYLLMLGSNDAKPANWNKEKYICAMTEIINDLRRCHAEAKIVLIVPPCVFENSFDISNDILKNEIIDAIQMLSKNEKLPIVNLYETTKEKPELFVDGVHPNEKGNAIIAYTVFKEIMK